MQVEVQDPGGRIDREPWRQRVQAGVQIDEGQAGGRRVDRTSGQRLKQRRAVQPLHHQVGLFGHVQPRDRESQPPDVRHHGGLARDIAIIAVAAQHAVRVQGEDIGGAAG